MGTKEIFAKNLKKARKDLGLTQEKFAEKIGIQWRNLTDLENGKYIPRPENIDRICEKLNMPVSMLFQETQEDFCSERAEKIKLINLKLLVLNDEKLNIAYKIITSAFD